MQSISFVTPPIQTARLTPPFITRPRRTSRVSPPSPFDGFPGVRPPVLLTRWCLRRRNGIRQGHLTGPLYHSPPTVTSVVTIDLASVLAPVAEMQLPDPLAARVEQAAAERGTTAERFVEEA